MSVVIRVAEPADLIRIKELYLTAGVTLEAHHAIDHFLVAVDDEEGVYGVIGLDTTDEIVGRMMPVVMQRNYLKVELLRMFVSMASQKVNRLVVDAADIGEWTDSGSAELLLKRCDLKRGADGLWSNDFALTDKYIFNPAPAEPSATANMHKYSGGTGWRRWAK